MLNEIIEEHIFVEQLDALLDKHLRVYEVKDAVSWTLARTPLLGAELPGYPGFRVYETNSFDRVPSFWILYKYDAPKEHIHLVAITQACEDDENL